MRFVRSIQARLSNCIACMRFSLYSSIPPDGTTVWRVFLPGLRGIAGRGAAGGSGGAGLAAVVALGAPGVALDALAALAAAPDAAFPAVASDAASGLNAGDN